MPGWHQKTHPREQMACKCGPGAGKRDGLVGESLGEPRVASPQLPSLAEQLGRKVGRVILKTGTWVSGAGWNGLGRRRRQQAAVLI